MRESIWWPGCGTTIPTWVVDAIDQGVIMPDLSDEAILRARLIEEDSIDVDGDHAVKMFYSGKLPARGKHLAELSDLEKEQVSSQYQFFYYDDYFFNSREGLEVLKWGTEGLHIVSHVVNKK